jgi:lipid-binding SYLF domain-containing protein
MPTTHGLRRPRAGVGITALVASGVVLGCSAGTTVLVSKTPVDSGSIPVLVGLPHRAFTTLAKVQSVAVVGSTDVENMLEDVRRQARQLGSDAVLINVGFGSTVQNADCWTLNGTAIRYQKP